MNIKPAVEVKKLEKLAFGDLCFFDLNNRDCCAAIKVNDPNSQYKVELLVLGPSFPDESEEPVLFPADDQISVLSFVEKYTVRFSTSPNEWSLKQPSGKVFLATDGTDVYLRLLQPGVIFINLKTGQVFGNRQPVDFLAYTQHWEIGFEDGVKFHTVVRSAEESKKLEMTQ